MSILGSALTQVTEVEVETSERMAQSDKAGIAMTVALLTIAGDPSAT